jgi:hypothetical protein
MLHQWEQLAQELLSDYRVETPVNAFDLAGKMGFHVAGGLRGRQALRIGNLAIQVNETAHERHQHAAVALEIAAWILGAVGPVTPQAREQVAAAILLPRAVLLEELGAGVEVPELHRRHRFTPYPVIALRCAQLTDVVAQVWRGGMPVQRFGPAYTRPSQRPTTAERELASRVRLSHATAVFGARGERAFAVGEEPGVEVVTLVPARDLPDANAEAHGVPLHACRV